MTKDEAITLEALKYAASMGHRLIGNFGPFTIKSTLAQPAQRPWVGLTHQQTKDCMQAWDGLDAYVLCRAIEAALKEKNT